MSNMYKNVSVNKQGLSKAQWGGEREFTKQKENKERKKREWNCTL